MTVVDLLKFKNRNKPLEFAWSFSPDIFYPITFKDLDRVLELLSISEQDITANIRYRS